MRTTISVDDHLLASARRRARQRGQSLGEVVEDALRRELAAPAQAHAPNVPVFRGGGGPVPGIDLTSNRALREALDRDIELDELR
jgi:Arc/MetJ family transcription regulator